MFDPTAIAAAELLSYFGKNTAVRIDHRYGASGMNVVVARTGNVIATIESYDFIRLQEVALEIQAMRKFPKPRNMKRAWSPIRLSEKAKEMMEADSGIRFA